MTIAASDIGILAAAIFYADDKFDKIKKRFEDYINCSLTQYNGTIGELDHICTCSLMCNRVVQNIKIAILKYRSEYVLITERKLSILKVVERHQSSLKIKFAFEIYDVNVHGCDSNVTVMVNNADTYIVYNVKELNGYRSEIYLPMESELSSLDELASFDTCLSYFHSILNGFTLPEPFFTAKLHENMELMFKIFRDPLLPSFQFQRCLDACMYLLPDELVANLRSIIGQYTSNYSSLFSRFPSNKLRMVIEEFLETFDDEKYKLTFVEILRPTLELAEIYANGIRGNAKHEIEKLLCNYLAVEVKFQECDDVESTDTVTNKISFMDLFSRSKLDKKNQFIIVLMEYLEKYLPGLITDIRPMILKLLRNLHSKECSKIVAKLREVLIVGETPSYEVRKNEIEAVFLKSMSRYTTYHTTVSLENLIYSNTEILDILSDFFYHNMDDIRRCALEVYVRRAYMAYDICSFNQSQLTSGQLCVLFKFSQTSYSDNRRGLQFKRSNSSVSLNNMFSSGILKYSPTSRKSVEMFNNAESSYSDEDLLINQSSINPSFLEHNADSALSLNLSDFSASASDQADCDSNADGNISRMSNSPSVHSLDKLLQNPISLSSLSGSSGVASNNSFNMNPQKYSRHLSSFYNQPPIFMVDGTGSNLQLGIMIIFHTLEDLERDIGEIKKLLQVNECFLDPNFIQYEWSSRSEEMSDFKNIVLNITLSDPNFVVKQDEETSIIFSNFCNKNCEELTTMNVTRITFLLQSLDRGIRYFTFRKKINYVEDVKFRQIDPALSFELEIERLKNYYLERLSVPNGRMYVYLGKLKFLTNEITIQSRLFVRSIIHHTSINSSTSTVEYVAREAEQNLVEAMDAVDIVYKDFRTTNTQSNHIFFHFHSIICLDRLEELESIVHSVIIKHGRRLWSLKITQAELKMVIQFNNNPHMKIPIRLWVHNEGGKSLEICIYKEEFQFTFGHKILLSWYQNRIGRYHGLPVYCFYSM